MDLCFQLTEQERFFNTFSMIVVQILILIGEIALWLCYGGIIYFREGSSSILRVTEMAGNYKDSGYETGSFCDHIVRLTIICG